MTTFVSEGTMHNPIIVYGLGWAWCNVATVQIGRVWLSRVKVEKTIHAQETQIVLCALLLMSSSNQVHDHGVNMELCNRFFFSPTKLKVSKTDKCGREHLPSKNHKITELNKSLSVFPWLPSCKITSPHPRTAKGQLFEEEVVQLSEPGYELWT